MLLARACFEEAVSVGFVVTRFREAIISVCMKYIW